MEQEGGADYVPAARAAIAALPDLLKQAEAAGAVVLARHLEQALSEAEGIVGRAPWSSSACRSGRRESCPTGVGALSPVRPFSR